jgi:hypothetical protein
VDAPVVAIHWTWLRSKRHLRHCVLASMENAPRTTHAQQLLQRSLVVGTSAHVFLEDGPDFDSKGSDTSDVKLFHQYPRSIPPSTAAAFWPAEQCIAFRANCQNELPKTTCGVESRNCAYKTRSRIAHCINRNMK